MEEEKLYTWSQIAKELNIPMEGLLKFAKSEGLIDEDGNPTQKAKDAGLFIDSIGMESN